MSRRTKIAPCPQHAGGESPKPAYLLRTCPVCMQYLGKHPEAADLATFGVPGHRPYRPGAGRGVFAGVGGI
jgi:hypothetical protein